MSCSVPAQPKPGELLPGSLRPAGIWGGARGLYPPWRGLGGAESCMEGVWGWDEEEGSGLGSVNAARCFLAHLRRRRGSICQPRAGGGLSPPGGSGAPAGQGGGSPEPCSPGKNPHGAEVEAEGMAEAFPYPLRLPGGFSRAGVPSWWVSKRAP